MDRELFLAFVIVVLAVVYGRGEDTTPEAITFTTYESQLIEKTNAERVARGLRPLVPDVRLQNDARTWCMAMAQRHSLQHSALTYARGENIAWNQSTPDEVIRCWMTSPGHRANMLGSGFTSIGVAAYVSPRDGSVYWIQQFR